MVKGISHIVIIEARDNYEAEEIADNLCNNGTIDLDYEDFNSREVCAIRETTECDENIITDCYPRKKK